MCDVQLSSRLNTQQTRKFSNCRQRLCVFSRRGWEKIDRRESERRPENRIEVCCVFLGNCVIAIESSAWLEVIREKCYWLGLRWTQPVSIDNFSSIALQRNHTKFYWILPREGEKAWREAIKVFGVGHFAVSRSNVVDTIGFFIKFYHWSWEREHFVTTTNRTSFSSIFVRNLISCSSVSSLMGHIITRRWPSHSITFSLSFSLSNNCKLYKYPYNSL